MTDDKPITFAELPPLNAVLRDGTFAGLTTSPDGTHHAVVLLGARPDERVTWQQALAWAKDIDAQLPSRPVAALLYANARDQIKPDWYWTSEPDGSSYAWYCYFDDGYQFCYDRSAKGCAVAVRLIPIVKE